jgi:hypothetical protein
MLITLLMMLLAINVLQWFSAFSTAWRAQRPPQAGSQPKSTSPPPPHVRTRTYKFLTTHGSEFFRLLHRSGQVRPGEKPRRLTPPPPSPFPEASRSFGRAHRRGFMEAAMAAMEAAADDVLASLSRAFCSTVAVFVQIQVSTFSALWWIVSCLWELYEAANGALLCYRGAILSGGEFCSPASWNSGLRCWKVSLLDTSLSVPFWIVATVRWWWTSLISTSWKLRNVSILCSCISLAIRRFYSFVTHCMPSVVGYLTPFDLF